MLVRKNRTSSLPSARSVRRQLNRVEAQAADVRKVLAAVEAQGAELRKMLAAVEAIEQRILGGRR